MVKGSLLPGWGPQSFLGLTSRADSQQIQVVQHKSGIRRISRLKFWLEQELKDPKGMRHDPGRSWPSPKSKSAKPAQRSCQNRQVCNRVVQSCLSIQVWRVARVDKLPKSVVAELLTRLGTRTSIVWCSSSQDTRTFVMQAHEVRSIMMQTKIVNTLCNLIIVF